MIHISTILTEKSSSLERRTQQKCLNVSLCFLVFFHYRLTTQLNKKKCIFFYFSYFFHIINNKQFSSLNERAVCVGAALERENSRLKRVKDWKYLWNGKFLILRECFFFRRVEWDCNLSAVTSHKYKPRRRRRKIIYRIYLRWLKSLWDICICSRMFYIAHCVVSLHTIK